MGVSYLFCPETGRRNRLVLVVDHLPYMDSTDYFLSLLVQRKRLIPNGFQWRFDSATGSKINNKFLAMTQEQINFLERFEVYLASRGFRVLKSAYNVEAIDKAELFGCIPSICRFSWQLYGYNPRVLLDVTFGLNSVQRSFPISLLMDYRAIGRDIFEAAIRSTMSSVADEIVHQFFKNIPK